MIQIESVHVEELRGIRDLTISPARSSFVIFGPNGSGKSGVVDAIQFALTGEISRLTGLGTGDLSLNEHGPHVLKRDYPDAAAVTIGVYIPDLAKSATLTRRISKPKQVVVTPADADVVGALTEVSDHPELTLSRREIIKFILTDPSKRSRDVQTLLKLEGIDVTRATLRTTENRLTAAAAAALSQKNAADESLRRHLDLPELREEDILALVNTQRTLLGSPPLSAPVGAVPLSDGVPAAARAEAAQDKESAIRDLSALLDTLSEGVERRAETAGRALARGIARLEAEPLLLEGIKTRPFVELGLQFLDGPACPLCETSWDFETLRRHLVARLDALREADALRAELVSASGEVAREILRLRGLLQSAAKLPEASGVSATLSEWSGQLGAFAQQLTTLEGTLASKERLSKSWALPPPGVSEQIERTRTDVAGRPDSSDLVRARDFLVVAQERWVAVQRTRRDWREKTKAAERGRIAYKAYCDSAEQALSQLYADVEADFGRFYRALNAGDEGKFSAKFAPADGKLGLKVEFHEQGMFPPSAYHSEGHQDGMGVCLYLALMKRVLGDRFRLAVLDDVVMSVDSQHRKQFCKLLKTEFPLTQFIITTHDEVWAKQMRTEGIVTSKSMLEFLGWSVETGPIVGESTDVWKRIEDDLTRNDVPAAAARLRRHLEFVGTEIADDLGAQVTFRSDANYDKGELLSAVLGRQRDLLGAAASAANSWKDDEQKAKISKLQSERAQILKSTNGEDWMINKGVHYNELVVLSAQDFRPAVEAYRNLLDLFRCSKCGALAALTPRFNPVALRCDCGTFNLNLKGR